MPPRSIKMLLLDSLEDLSAENFDKFRYGLLDRSEEPRVRRCRVEGKSRLEVVDVLVSTFTEEKAVGVTEEILREIRCIQEADRLGEEEEEEEEEELQAPEQREGLSPAALKGVSASTPESNNPLRSRTLQKLQAEEEIQVWKQRVTMEVEDLLDWI